MGWASGSSLFTGIIHIIKPAIPDEKKRQKVYVKLIDLFGDADCDTLDECLDHDPAFDVAFNNLYPPTAD